MRDRRRVHSQQESALYRDVDAIDVYRCSLVRRGVRGLQLDLGPHVAKKGVLAELMLVHRERELQWLLADAEV